MKKLWMKSWYIIFLTVICAGCIDDTKITPGIRGEGRPVFDNDATAEMGKTAVSITVTATLLQENGVKITRRGFCYGKTASPTIEQNQSIEDNGSGIGTYTLTINGLQHNETYYVRPYAINAVGTQYGTKMLTIVTNPGLGIVETLAPADVHVTKATVGGRIESTGEGTVEKRGILLASSEADMNNPSIPKDTLISTDETAVYLCYMTGLNPSQTYYVQAFVQNTFGIFVGAVESLTTDDGLFQVSNATMEAPGFIDVFAYSSVILNDANDAGVWIVRRGFCWSNTPEPTIFDDTIVCGDGVGAFSGLISPLYPQHPYYIRAYAVNNFDSVIYGNGNIDAIYTIDNRPIVQTDSAYNMISGSVTLSGVITSEGMSDVTSAGFYWSRTNPNPTDQDNVLPVSFIQGEPIELSGQVNGLTGGQTYYFKAYAANNEGLSEGVTVAFTTPPIFDTSLPKFPGEMRDEGTSAYFNVNSFLYLLGGDLGATYTNELWRFSITNNRWESRLAFTEGAAKWQTGVTFGYNGFIYGGLGNGSVEMSNIYSYNHATNMWEYFDEAPDTLHQTLGFAYSSHLFFIGGKRDTVKNDVWLYSPNYKGWTQLDTFPVKQYGGVAAVISGVIYAGMGFDETGVCNKTFWTSVDFGDQWTYRTDCHFISGNILGGVGCDDRRCIYVIDDQYYIYEYNTVSTVWKQKARLPVGYRRLNCLFEVNSMLYIGLGDSANALTIYDPTWDND